MPIWVLAADSSHAQLLQAEKRNGPLLAVEAFTHPESRLKNSDLDSDGRGRSFDSAGQGRHAVEPQVDSHEMQAVRFAHELCAHLREKALEKAFSRIYILAAPGFLGKLRDCLDDNVKKRISGEISKNVARESPEAIRRQLPEYL
ncbi:MAG TPA: host attachment protein [Chromatiaceae bacterium]|nr:host attachment protein [Chromatiaceae bacterium]